MMNSIKRTSYLAWLTQPYIVDKLDLPFFLYNWLKWNNVEQALWHTFNVVFKDPLADVLPKRMRIQCAKEMLPSVRMPNPRPHIRLTPKMSAGRRWILRVLSSSSKDTDESPTIRWSCILGCNGKTNSTWRFVVEFCSVKVTVKDSYPLSDPEGLLYSSNSRVRIISKIELRDGRF